MKIRTKFIIVFFALSLGPLALIGAIAYGNGQRAIEESLGRLFELAPPAASRPSTARPSPSTGRDNHGPASS